MKIYIVGIGMDGGKTLTDEARKAIYSAEVLIGAKRMTEPFVSLGKTVVTSWKTDEICEYIEGGNFGTAAVLMSGDCGFFSGAEALVKRLAGYDTEIIAGISAPVYLCAKLGLPWQDMKFVSLHGTDGNIVRNVRRYARCFFLLGGSITPTDICKRLCEYDMGDIAVHIGARLAYPDERIISGTAEELSTVKCDSLCAVITENPSPETRVRCGIPDSEFLRVEVPMTKSEIRAAVAAKLGVRETDTVWDVGCGTGSVSVECALAANDGIVYAVDRNDTAAELTALNARKFGCDNIRIICGKAPEALRELPVPDKLFIGGAGGHISAILEAAHRDGNSPRIVITAVSLETLHEAVTALKERGLAPGITQISAVRSRVLGTHTMPDPQSPVFIIEGGAE